MAGPFAVLHEASQFCAFLAGSAVAYSLVLDGSGWPSCGGALEVLLLRVEERAVSLKTHR